MTTQYNTINSHLGEVWLAGDEAGLSHVCFPEQRERKCTDDWQFDANSHLEACKQLQAYFAGELTQFDLPLNPQGTEFQRAVWQALCDVPYGTICSYQDIANMVGRPKAVRAVGAANGNNPIAIIVPCHRIIGSNGKLTGYMGGLHLKKGLLKLEGFDANRMPGE